MLASGRGRWSVTQTPQLKFLCGDPWGSLERSLYFTANFRWHSLTLKLALTLTLTSPCSFFFLLTIVYCLYISKDLRIKGRTMPNRPFYPCIKRRIRGDNMHSWTWPSIPPLTSSKHRHVNFYLNRSKCHHRHLAHLTRNILRLLFCMLCFLFRKEG